MQKSTVVVSKTKACCRCGLRKSVTQFYKRGSASDRFYSYCKACHRAYMKAREAEKRLDDKLQQRAYTANQYAVINGVEGEITKEDVSRQLELQQGRCFYCGIEMDLDGSNAKYSASIEHMIPMSQGGLNVAENIVMSCRSCNSAKRSKSAAVFIKSSRRVGAANE